MNRLILGLAFAIAIASSLQAQSLTARADIPFDFWLGKTVMPAGAYQVQYSNGLLQVRDEASGGAGGSVLTIPEYKLNPPTKTVLVFNRYGETYFLRKLSAPDLSGGCILPESSREKEVLSQIRAKQPVLIALHRK